MSIEKQFPYLAISIDLLNEFPSGSASFRVILINHFNDHYGDCGTNIYYEWLDKGKDGAHLTICGFQYFIKNSSPAQVQLFIEDMVQWVRENSNISITFQYMQVR